MDDVFQGLCFDIFQVPGEDAADGAATTTDDPLRYGPRPEELVPRTGAAADGAAASDGVYRPPKLNPAAMEVCNALLLSTFPTCSATVMLLS